MKALLIFPHQLFENHPGFSLKPDVIVLIEDSLFFGDTQYPANFHRQKLMLHRASMQFFVQTLRSQEYRVDYFESANHASELTVVIDSLVDAGVKEINTCDVVDFSLSQRLEALCKSANIGLSWLTSPGFFNTDELNNEYRSGKKRWYMADYYKWQRQRLNILIGDDNQPAGGKWSFDEDNRKKLPKKKLSQIPALTTASKSSFATEAENYVNTHFPNALGELESPLYPSTHTDARKWFNEFLEKRLAEFGPYEDAIVENENWLYHSVLTPMLNTGLLTPAQLIRETLAYAHIHNTPIASLEGFIRQVIGWREFMRATYDDLGVAMRTSNHWQHDYSMPESFYNATTGVLPVDNAISRVLSTGYCHHIERLMVLGGFMFLCEIKPNDIYLWFMELFVDSYDWVMVPNVYAMSQNADGGLITTKPYFSGSNYIRKMSHYPKEDWCDIWDALYWRWIFKQADSLRKNPRWAMMVRNAEKMDDDRKQRLTTVAEDYLRTLHAR